MIFSHLPGPPQIIDFPLGGKGEKYFVVDGENKRVVVMEKGQENLRNGYRILAEINPDNLYMLAPGWQIYTRLCWRKWGVYEEETQSL